MNTLIQLPEVTKIINAGPSYVYIQNFLNAVHQLHQENLKKTLAGLIQQTRELYSLVKDEYVESSGTVKYLDNVLGLWVDSWNLSYDATWDGNKAVTDNNLLFACGRLMMIYRNIKDIKRYFSYLKASPDNEVLVNRVLEIEKKTIPVVREISNFRGKIPYFFDYILEYHKTWGVAVMLKHHLNEEKSMVMLRDFIREEILSHGSNPKRVRDFFLINVTYTRAA